MENIEKVTEEVEVIEEPEVVEEKKTLLQKVKDGVKTNGPIVAKKALKVALVAAVGIGSFALGGKGGATKLEDETPDNATRFDGSDDEEDDDESEETA